MNEENRMRILYVEDTKSDQMILKHSLEEGMMLDFELLTADTATDGLRSIERHLPDLIVLDYKLPGMNGLEFLEELAKKGLKPPVIFVTGKGDEKIAVEAMKHGARDYIVKDEIISGTLVKSIMEIFAKTALPDTIDRRTADRLSQLFSGSKTIEIGIGGILRVGPEGDIADKALYSALEDMVKAGLLEAFPLGSIIKCPACDSPVPTYHLKCQTCESKLFTKGDVVEHFECGHTNFREKFLRGKDEMVCPKCGKKLKAIGVDYRSAGNWFKCQKEHFFGSPAVIFSCNECHEEFGLQKAEFFDMKKYVLTQKGNLSLRLAGIGSGKATES